MLAQHHKREKVKLTPPFTDHGKDSFNDVVGVDSYHGAIHPRPKRHARVRTVTVIGVEDLVTISLSSFSEKNQTEKNVVCYLVSIHRRHIDFIHSMHRSDLPAATIKGLVEHVQNRFATRDS